MSYRQGFPYHRRDLAMPTTGSSTLLHGIHPYYVVRSSFRDPTELFRGLAFHIWIIVSKIVDIFPGSSGPYLSRTATDAGESFQGFFPGIFSSTILKLQMGSASPCCSAMPFGRDQDLVLCTFEVSGRCRTSDPISAPEAIRTWVRGTGRQQTARRIPESCLCRICTRRRGVEAPPNWGDFPSAW